MAFRRICGMTDVSELIAAGMARQMDSFHAEQSAGMPRLGWKIGLNDPAAQQRLGLPSPVVGWLDGRRLIRAGEPYAPPAGAKPRVEAETAILLASDIPAEATADEARSAIAAVAPAIEFVNAAKPLVPVDELLAHDILHEAVLLGPGFEPSFARGLVEAGFPSVTNNGEVVRTALPGRYPDDLGEIVSLVASTLARHGEALRAGDWIIGGSYIDPFDIAPGDSVRADFGPMGVVAFDVT